MLLDPDPNYRKVIVSWYDSEIVTIILLVFLAAVIGFAYFGILTAYETMEYRRYVWIPGLMMGLSLTVFLTSIVRLFRRYIPIGER
jgi:hypothetical protein